MQRRTDLVWMATIATALGVAPKAHAQTNDNCNQSYTGSACVSAQNSNGNGASGVYATNTSSLDPAVYGINSGSGWGVIGTGGAGVLGTSTNSGVGVEGDAVGGGTDGVYGVTDAGTHAGVSGVNSAGSGNAYGVFGQSTNGYAVYASGTLAYTGSLTHVSDVRLKKNIKPIETPLERVLKLRGVTFEWNEPEKHGGATAPQTGFIAQEVEREFPTWVREDMYGYKMMSTDGVDAMLVEALRTLKTENDVLRAKSSNLEDRLKSLEANRRPLISGMGEGGIGFGLAAMAGAVVFTRRKRSDSDN